MIIEVYKVEERGHGGILTDEFISWRMKHAAVSNAVQINGLPVTMADDTASVLANMRMC